MPRSAPYFNSQMNYLLPEYQEAADSIPHLFFSARHLQIWLNVSTMSLSHLLLQLRRRDGAI